MQVWSTANDVLYIPGYSKLGAGVCHANSPTELRCGHDGHRLAQEYACQVRSKEGLKPSEMGRPPKVMCTLHVAGSLDIKVTFILR